MYAVVSGEPPGTGSGPVSAAARRWAVLFAFLLACCVCGCGDGGRGGVDASSTASPSPTPSPPRPAAVYLLGGSSARECITSNRSLAQQVTELYGSTVTVQDLAASERTYADDLRLLDRLPSKRTFVLIGVSVGRYTQVPGPSTSPLPRSKRVKVAVGRSPDGPRHRYTEAEVLSQKRKAELVTHWVTERYPFFQQNYARNARGLETLVRRCVRLGLHPVLLELPLNAEVVKQAFAKPRARYTSQCRRLAEQFEIPYWQCVDDLPLPSTDFYDLMHLVEPGRRAWEGLLTTKLVDMLSGLDGAG